MAEGELGEPAVVVTKAYDFAMWLLPKVEKFPRSYKFSVGDRLVGQWLDLLLLLVEAAYAQSGKAKVLEEASAKVNGSRYLLRMAKDLKLLSLDAYGFAAERLEEIGRMVGGWKKSVAVRRP